MIIQNPLIPGQLPSGHARWRREAISAHYAEHTVGAHGGQTVLQQPQYRDWSDGNLLWSFIFALQVGVGSIPYPKQFGLLKEQPEATIAQYLQEDMAEPRPWRPGDAVRYVFDQNSAGGVP